MNESSEFHLSSSLMESNAASLTLPASSFCCLLDLHELELSIGVDMLSANEFPARMTLAILFCKVESQSATTDQGRFPSSREERRGGRGVV